MLQFKTMPLGLVNQYRLTDATFTELKVCQLIKFLIHVLVTDMNV